jgi:hypothetical protein
MTDNRSILKKSRHIGIGSYSLIPQRFLIFRGDYLCEALEWIAWDEIYQAKPYPVFNIR